ncbi:hypothetical protein [Caldimonas sp. KR1-144]|uniref:hypothetical protein n=1 Tax=Caldimonas sp. KR1-144 TaxID=3400911 RepID=UPI003C0ABC1A
MSTLPAPYQPISCEFHDVLEAHATVRQPVAIRFRDADGGEQRRVATITDVFARAGAEYLSVSGGETLRLDQLIEVGDARLADFC